MCKQVIDTKIVQAPVGTAANSMHIVQLEEALRKLYKSGWTLFAADTERLSEIETRLTFILVKYAPEATVKVTPPKVQVKAKK